MNFLSRTDKPYAKAITLSMFVVLRLGTSVAAFAQGLPPGAVPAVYGSPAFHSQSYHNKIIFSRILDYFKHHRNEAQHRATAANGN